LRRGLTTRFDDFEIVRDSDALAQHDGCGATFLGRQFDGALDLLCLQAPAGDDEMNMFHGKDAGYLFGAFGGQFHAAIGDGLACLSQVRDHVERREGAEPSEHQIHRANDGIPAAGFGWPVDDDGVPAFRFADERHVVDPDYRRFDGMCRARSSGGGTVSHTRVTDLSYTDSQKESRLRGYRFLNGMDRGDGRGVDTAC
jgi:hypothetical protein